MAGDDVVRKGHHAQPVQDAAGQAGLLRDVVLEVDRVVVARRVGVAHGLVGGDDDVGTEAAVDGEGIEGCGFGGALEPVGVVGIALPRAAHHQAGGGVDDDDAVLVDRAQLDHEQLARAGRGHLREGRRRRHGVVDVHGGTELQRVLGVQQAHHVDPEERIEHHGAEGRVRKRGRQHRRHAARGQGDDVAAGRRGRFGKGTGVVGADDERGERTVLLAKEALVQGHARVYVVDMDVVDALLSQAPRHPQRIVAMTEETTETLYRLGLGDRIVGVSCFTLRPKVAKDKPKVSSFLDANFEKIIDLKPDLVVGFSDLQGEIARELAKRGVPVVVFNQRSVAEILQTIAATAALVGESDAGIALVDELTRHLRDVAGIAAGRRRRPRVFFEEWPDPVISAIRWVSELIELAGGDELFKETRARHDAKGRIITVDDVIARDPEVIIASWCGKKVKRDSIAERYASTTAVQNDAIYEIPSELILQPGPACLTDGVDALLKIIGAIVDDTPLAPAHPGEARRGDDPRAAWGV